MLQMHFAQSHMMNSVKSRWLSLPLVVLSFQYGLAQAPSGPVNFAFNTASTAVYDLSSTYTFSQDITGAGGTPVPLTIIDMPLTHSASGLLQGSGFIVVTIGSDSAVAARYKAAGRVSGGGNHPTHVLLNVRLSGNDVVTGVQTRFSIDVHYDLEVDAETLSLIGSARGHASFSNLSGGSINSDNLSVPLPPGVDGTWSAQLDVVSLTSLAGSGNVVLSNGRTLPVRLAGSFSGVTGLSRIHVWGIKTGDNDGRPTNLRMLFATDAAQPDSLNGTILGQKVMQ